MDPYTAEKLVASKQAELRAEAKQAALREVCARESDVTEHLLSIRAIKAAGRLARRGLTQVWNGSIKGATAFGRASR